MDHFPIGTTEQFRSLWIVSFRNIYNLQLPKPEQGDVNCLSDNRLPDSLHVLNQGSFHYPLVSDHLYQFFLQFYGRQKRRTQIIKDTNDKFKSICGNQSSVSMYPAQVAGTGHQHGHNGSLSSYNLFRPATNLSFFIFLLI